MCFNLDWNLLISHRVYEQKIGIYLTRWKNAVWSQGVLKASDVIRPKHDLNLKYHKLLNKNALSGIEKIFSRFFVTF